MTSEFTNKIAILSENVVAFPKSFANLDEAILFLLENWSFKDPAQAEQPTQLNVEYVFVSNGAAHQVTERTFSFSDIDVLQTPEDLFKVLRVPNAETLVALEEAESITSSRFKNVDEMFEHLDQITSAPVSDNQETNIYESEFPPSEEEIALEVKQNVQTADISDASLDATIMVASASLEGNPQVYEAFSDINKLTERMPNDTLLMALPVLNHAVSVDQALPDSVQEPAFPVTVIETPDLKYRVFENGLRLSSVYVDWSTDTFDTQQEAHNLIYRWNFPGQDFVPSMLPLISLNEPMTFKDESRTYHIEQIDLNQEPPEQREIGLNVKCRKEDEGIVVTTTPDGRCVLVSRQDKEHRILDVLWEAKPQLNVPETWKKIVYLAVHAKKKFVPVNLSAKDVLAINSRIPQQLGKEQLELHVQTLIQAQHDAVIKYKHGHETQAIENLIQYLKALHQ